MKKQGFTLIELLVVIAIIGILAGIVLVSLGGARTRAKDARIISDMSQLRTTAEIYYSSDANYARVVAGDDDIDKLIADITTQGSTLTIEQNIAGTECDGSSTSGFAADSCYCAYVQLNAPATDTWYCVDGPGMAAEQTTTNPNTTCIGTAANDTVCP